MLRRASGASYPRLVALKQRWDPANVFRLNQNIVPPVARARSLVHVDEENPATRALAVSGLEHSVTRHGRVRSLAEAAAARGVDPSAIVKTMVVRRGEGDHLFVLVPGDRQISWPKLRALLGVNRISLPDADAARNVTGYERGTITPFGSATVLPVVADERIVGQTISIGAGGHGVAATVSGDDVIAHFDAQVADVTDPV